MKGLSFSEPMVKAWMEGRKTVTRRLIKVPPIGISDIATPEEWNYRRADDRMPIFETWGPQSGTCLFRDDKGRVYGLKPLYRPGEIIYIKETWTRTVDRAGRILYRADDGYIKSVAGYPVKWESPRFMPEWASRSHALIVSVIPERIQEISENDATNEGMDGHCPEDKMTWRTPREQFQNIWESLHPGSWERNDWVWRYELEKRP
jgi:hypothetical protein